MNLRFLRALDRWLGPPLLALLVPFTHLLEIWTNEPVRDKPRHVFLKLKGGGSLLIAMPALLALRRESPDIEFTLVCTQETKTYAELLGIFDDYSVIDDRSFVTLLPTAFHALKQSWRAELCVDLEPNSILAAAFCLLTLAKRRIGLVKAETPFRKAAYTDALSFNVYAPIYVYYDQIAAALEVSPAPISECRDQLLRAIPKRDKPAGGRRTLGLAPFTSKFAQERMMPVETWLALFAKRGDIQQARFLVFGSERNKAAGEEFLAQLRQAMPGAEGVNLCGLGALSETATEIGNLDEFWSVDSGLLHLARLLGVACRSFWGPTMPSQRLRPIPGLAEETLYRHFPCSPCVHLPAPPCGGNNLCMKTMADPLPETAPALWL